MKKLLSILLVLVLTLSFCLVSCDFGKHSGDDQNDENQNNENNENNENNNVENGSNNDSKYDCITVAKALELCGEPGNITTERYYIKATIVSIENAAFGEMIIADDTGSIYVYGTFSADGSIQYPEFEEKPVKGDEVILHCILQNYNGTKEVKNARLIEFTKGESTFNEADYTDMSIAEAREAAVGTKIKTDGVVARITFANGMVPSGFILIDETSSIYVYDGNAAQQVAIGNKVTVVGEKTYWILADEQSNAEKFGYKGACQLADANIVTNDKKTNDFDTSSIESTTLKEILDTPVSENITSKVYKITALVEKREGTGFTNYYFHDLDEVTSTYTYTQCNGKDFTWIDEFDGKICTVYITALNAKSTKTECYFRVLPIKIVDENFVFNVNDTAKFVVDYIGATQFENVYSGDPALELVTSHSSTILGFNNAPISYSSSDSNVISFTEENGKLIMHCNPGVATITISSEFNGVSYSKNIVITVKTNINVEYITVSEAIAAENNTVVTVKGIVGPSAVNQTGFYLIDESGAIAVLMDSATLKTLKIGYEVILRGTRTITKDGGGQINISDCEVIVNNYGSNEYSTKSFVTDKTLADLKNMADTPENTTTVYVITAKFKLVQAQYYSNIYVTDGTTDILLYTSKASQYSWAYDFTEDVIIEIALCDWNAKGLKGAVLAVYTADGKVLNELNFG